MYNELKAEIELEKEKLQKDMDKYLEIDTETDEILANIAEVAVNIGVFLKSPILGTKKDILRLILSDCKIEGKIYVFQQISRPINSSKRLKLINGARYYARIGLKSMGILSD